MLRIMFTAALVVSIASAVSAQSSYSNTGTCYYTATNMILVSYDYGNQSPDGNAPIGSCMQSHQRRRISCFAARNGQYMICPGAALALDDGTLIPDPSAQTFRLRN
jgi:hypothetical protein